MGTLENIVRHQLTGSRGVSEPMAHINPDGLVGDRAFVLYDPSTIDRVRVSQKQVPALAQLVVTASSTGSIIELTRDDGVRRVERNVFRIRAHSLVEVDEFGDKTPCRDFGNADANEYLSELAGREVKLAKKLSKLIRKSPYFPRPQDRKNAPIHIVSQDSVNELHRKVTEDGADISVEELAMRFRYNLLIGGIELPEQAWIGKRLVVGQMTLMVDKLTARCAVPGFDRFTGKNMKDVPRQYRTLPKTESRKPGFGVYAHVVPNVQGKTDGFLWKGDEVSLLD